jgi:hypothetical protein
VIARRILAIPLIFIGGLLYLATGLGIVGIGFYTLYFGIKRIAEGHVGEGVGIIFISGTAATFVLGLLTLPAGALLAAGEWLWSGGDDPADVENPVYEDADFDDAEDEDEFDDEELGLDEDDDEVQSDATTH